MLSPLSPCEMIQCEKNVCTATTSCHVSVWWTYSRLCRIAQQYINTLCVFTVHIQSFFLFFSLKASSSSSSYFYFSSSLFKTQTLSCIFTAKCVNHQCWLYSFSCPPRLSRVEEILGLLCMMLFSERPNCRAEVRFLLAHVCMVRDGIERDMRAVKPNE